MKPLLGVLAILLSGPLTLAPQSGAPSRQVEWLYYGGDPGGSRYSPLADINAQNVGLLRPAWQWQHWETPLEPYGTTPAFSRIRPS